MLFETKTIDMGNQANHGLDLYLINNQHNMRCMMTSNNQVNDLYRQAMSAFVDKNYDRAIELLSEALTLDPDFIMGYTSRGAAFLQQDLPKNAIADFNRAINADGQYPKAFHLRGLAREKLQEHAAAMQDFDRAIELDPEYGAAYYSRANLNIKLGNTDDASDDIEIVTHLTNRTLEEFSNDNNIWRSRHLQLEDAIESEMQR